ncbi:MAG: A24 family peptidase [Desulfobacteraceae bacterium]|jgi:leader peptidase (prepilin peptidase)/N-methyltransferase
MSDLLFYIFTFIAGLCVGSFLNVCIYRIPVKKSIIHPGSACPSCQNPIRFYDNIPIFSYLIVQGRCRYCGNAIAIRYPIVELLGGLFAICLALKFGQTLTTLVYYIFVAALLVITFIDIDHQIIPNEISLPGIPAGFVCSFFIPVITPVESLLGIIVGGGTLWAVASLYLLFTQREGMGFGDVKLLGMIGAFIGWKGVLLTIFAASAIGSTVGFITMLKNSKNMKMAIPFGPFLSIGAIIYLFFGVSLINWYIYGSYPL